jgi:hypothetical protein
VKNCDVRLSEEKIVIYAPSERNNEIPKPPLRQISFPPMALPGALRFCSVLKTLSSLRDDLILLSAQSRGLPMKVAGLTEWLSCCQMAQISYQPIQILR